MGHQLLFLVREGVPHTSAKEAERDLLVAGGSAGHGKVHAHIIGGTGEAPSGADGTSAGGATASAGEAIQQKSETEQYPDAAEARKVSKKPEVIEQEQPLRAAESDRCTLRVRTRAIPETPRHVYSNAAGDLHRPQKDQGDSGLDVTSFDQADISTEAGVVGKKLKFKAPLTQSTGLVAAMVGPKEVMECMVRFVCNVLKTWSFGVCILKCQNEPAEVALQKAMTRDDDPAECALVFARNNWPLRSSSQRSRDTDPRLPSARGLPV